MACPCSIEHFVTSNFIQWEIDTMSFKNYSSIYITSLTSKDYSQLKTFNEQYDILYIQTINMDNFDLISNEPDLYRSLQTRFNLHQEYINTETLYPLFYDLLIRLKPKLQSQLDVYTHRSSGLLCAQIRTDRNLTFPNHAVFPYYEKPITKVLEFLKSKQSSNTKILVTTDSQDVQQLVQRMLPAHYLVQIISPITHIAQYSNYSSCESLGKAIIEFHLLAECDLIITLKSSFGYFAVMRREDPFKKLFLYCYGLIQIHNTDDYNKYTYSTC
ncbi:unnamed protein product [Didymodactylos carnosus]|uniref:Uncharacterized protein n=1 Tax=Didymodactylos carnosus TaxID=1234261 RepID=A0A814EKS1_9BILA|nr:unnamed protein product [Didymodactylos carnosus]CAF1279492.1 unnamed protein product [Didymodactylos carnosus]CAF3743882.1 unnamed protein product [Didymodactylos carnosus]CAF4084402.1 unnamed protein product [Didymodactylos carnosus]